MSVIGRMDKQVDDVLISPLARKNQQETEARDEKTAPRDLVRTEREEMPSTQNRRAANEELPIWLL